MKSLIQESDVLSLYLKCAEDFFTECATLTEEEAGDISLSGERNQRRHQQPKLNLSHALIQADRSPWERILNDLEIIMNHLEAALPLLFDEGLFRKWLRILDIMQGMLRKCFMIHTITNPIVINRDGCE